MRVIILCLVSITVIWIVAITSCKKEKDTGLNRPPIAHAGKDQTLSIQSCYTTANTILDGSASSDPDNDISQYKWTKLWGPSVLLRNSTSSKANLENVNTGTYAFELEVTDAGGRKAKDTVSIVATGPVKEYDFDVSFSGPFIFLDNYADCYYYNPCTYADVITTQGTVNYPTIGDFNLYASETADTANSNYANYSYINFYSNSNLSISGPLNISFKKLMEHGGGPFSGTFKIESGSAQNCQSKIFNGLSPLTVTGNMDVLTNRIDMRIVGKVYF